MLTLRFSRISLLFIFALAGIAQTSSTKRPLHHRDYDPWKTISGQVLSHDGKFLAYSLFPEEGDGEIVVRNLATGKEARESAGSLPRLRIRRISKLRRRRQEPAGVALGWRLPRTENF